MYRFVKFCTAALVCVVVLADVGRAELSIQQMFDRMASHGVTGATIITHGFTPTDGGGDYMMPLAQSVRNELLAQSGGNVWLLDYDLTSDGGTGVFNTSTSVLPPTNASAVGHVILLFDWGPESNETSRWWAETAGDALFSLGTGLGLFDPRRQQAPPTHFIGHSFGTVATTEAVERLAAYDVAIDQVTLLDPHDFDQSDVPNFLSPNYDGLQRMFELGAPNGYGATIWDNVEFADVYYQTRGNQGTAASFATADPEGRPISGAYNRHLSDGEELPTGNPYGLGTSSDHGYTWNTFYTATVTGNLPPGAAAPADANLDFNSTGWAYSVHNSNRLPLPAANFYEAGQDHQHSDSSLVFPDSTPNYLELAEQDLSTLQVTQGRWAPQFQPGDIANGDFSGGQRSDSTEDLISGWSNHGGGGDSEINNQSGNNYMQLDANDEQRSHNYTYIPINAATLNFDIRIDNPSSDDWLSVIVGDETLVNYSLANPTDWIRIERPIPVQHRDSVATFGFDLGFGSNVFDDPAVHIDNVSFGMVEPLFAGTQGPGSEIDLGTLFVGESLLSDSFGFSNFGANSFLDVLAVEFSDISGGAELWDAPNFTELLGVGFAAPLNPLDFEFLGADQPGEYRVLVNLVTNDSRPISYELVVAVVQPDFNGDGFVDAADYTVWRDSLGSTTGSVADGDGSGLVDEADYLLWRQYFGQSIPTVDALTETAVPEPSSILICLAAVFAFACSGRMQTAGRGVFGDNCKQRSKIRAPGVRIDTANLGGGSL